MKRTVFNFTARSTISVSKSREIGIDPLILLVKLRNNCNGVQAMEEQATVMYEAN